MRGFFFSVLYQKKHRMERREQVRRRIAATCMNDPTEWAGLSDEELHRIVVLLEDEDAVLFLDQLQDGDERRGPCHILERLHEYVRRRQQQNLVPLNLWTNEPLTDEQIRIISAMYEGPVNRMPIWRPQRRSLSFARILLGLGIIGAGMYREEYNNPGILTRTLAREYHRIEPHLRRAAQALNQIRTVQVATEAMRLYDLEWTTAVPPELYYVRSVPFTHPHSPAITTALMHEAFTESIANVAQKYGEANARELWAANQQFAPRFFQYTGACDEVVPHIPGVKYYYGQNMCSVTKDTYFHACAITPESARRGFHVLLQNQEQQLHAPNTDTSQRGVSAENLVAGYKWILNHFTRLSWDQVLHQQYTQLEAVFDEAADGDVIMMINAPSFAGSASYFGAHLLLMVKQLLLHNRLKRLHFYNTAVSRALGTERHADFVAWSQARPSRWVQGQTRIHLIYMNDGDYSGLQLRRGVPYYYVGISDIPTLLLPPHVLDRVHVVAISALHTSRVPPLLDSSVDYRGGECVELIDAMMEREQLPWYLQHAVSKLLNGDIHKPLVYLDFKIPDFVSIPHRAAFLIDGDMDAFYHAHKERRVLPHDQTFVLQLKDWGLENTMT